MRLSLPPELSPPSLDDALAPLGLPWRPELDGTSWLTPADQVPALILDFSRLRFASIQALAQLVITVHALIRDGGTVHIRPPSDLGAAQFIGASNLYAVLGHSPEKEVQLLGLHADANRPSRYDRLFPLQWLPGEMSPRAWVKHVLTRPVGPAQKLLPPRDVAQIAVAILDELLENVDTHSGRRSALVGIQADSDDRSVSTSDFSLSERPAFLTARASTRASLKLVVADAGVGVFRRLAGQRPDVTEDQVLAYAFDRWSSSVNPSPERGTRGLYRVARLAARHSGFTTLRSGAGAATEYSESMSGGRPCPTETTTVFPGTLIRVDIPLSVDPRPVARGVGFQRRLEFVKLTEGRRLHRHALLQAARRAHANKAIMVVDAQQIGDRGLAEELVIDLAELAHPALTAVLNCPVSDAQLENFADSVNSRVQLLQEHDHHRAFEPVLLVGTRLDTTEWAGMSSAVGGQLNISRVGHEIDDSSLPPQYFARQRQEKYLVLSKETLYVSMHASFQQQAQELLRQPGPGSVFCTPSLALVQGYSDVPQLLQRTEPAHELLLRCMVEQVRRATQGGAIDNAVLLYEEGILDRVAKRFAALLRGTDSIQDSEVQPVTKRDLDQGRRLHVPRESEILILGRSAAEGQTARNVGAFVLRQGYSLVGAMSFVDAGTGKNSMELWGEPFPRMAAATLGVVVNATDEKLVFIDGDGEPEKARSMHSLSAYTSVLNEIAELDALYLGHYIGDHDRHFTYVVSAQKYFSSNTPPPSLDKLLTSVSYLQVENRLARVCYGIDNWPGRPSVELARIVARHCNVAFPPLGLASITARRAKRSKNESLFVFVAWVAISGAAIQEILNRMVDLGSESIEIHVLFSQLPHETERLFASLKTVASGTGHEMSVRVIFYARLPFASFEPRACPMCLQQPSEWHGETFAIDRQPSERQRSFLALRPWSVDEDEKHDIFAFVHGGAQSQEFESATRRAELVRAAGSTQALWELQRRWMANEAVVPSIAALLLCEPQWLRQEPLANDATRTWLAGRLIHLLSNMTQSNAAEQVRILRALRLVAKTALARHVPEIVRAICNQPETLAVLATQVMEICSRPYLKGSGLLRDLAAGLKEASIEADATPGSKRLADMLGELVRVADRAAIPSSRTKGVRIATARRELLDALDRFEGHLVNEPYRDCLKYDDVDRCLEGWRTVQRWVRLDFAGPYVHLFNHLISTSYLADAPAARRIFDPRSGDRPIHEIVASLIRAKAEGAEINPSLVFRMERVKKDLDNLFIPQAGQTESLTRLAVGAVGVTLGDVIERLVALDQSGLILKEVPDDIRRVPLWIPDRVAESVVRIVAGNMSEHGSPGTQLEVSAPRDERYPGHQCVAFLARPVDVSPRARSKPGRGGLKDLQDEIPYQVGFVDYHPMDDGFALLLYVRNYLQNPREES